MSIFKFNRGDTSSVGSATVYSFVPLTINKIKLRGTNTNTKDGSVTVTVRDSSSTFTSEVFTVTAGTEFEHEFDIEFTSTGRSTITISVARTRATVYGGRRIDDEQYWPGAEAYTSSTNMYNCEIDVSVNIIWKTEGAWLGLIDNSYVPWTDWERDENGYPKNAGVWRIDGNNKHYPWIIGFEPYTPSVTGTVFINTSDGLVKYMVYLNSEEGLLPVQLYINDTSGLLPLQLV